MNKLVVLKLEGDVEVHGLKVTLEIGEENLRPHIENTGFLPPNPSLAAHLQEHWLEKYRPLGAPYRHQFHSLQKLRHRVRHLLGPKVAKITPKMGAAYRIKPKAIKYNGSIYHRIAECRASGHKLQQEFQSWLESDEFRPLDQQLREEINRDETIRVVIRTENELLQKLPWHLWDVVERYPNTEVALGSLHRQYRPTMPLTRQMPKVRILAILGHSQGIDVEKDRQLLESLPNAEVIFLVEPNHQKINDNLWEQSWDIIFFAGHSETDGEVGKIYINPTDSLTLTDLWYALRKAVERGLQLAIFNSCDGLGLARQLDDVQIPQMIVMRELVPDQVAQEFLKHFLRAFAGGQSFYLAVREARERLQGWESQFPCASWLPMIYQNPTVVPPMWDDFLQGPNPPSLAIYPPIKNPVVNRGTRKFSASRLSALYPLVQRHQKLSFSLLMLFSVAVVSWTVGVPQLAKMFNNLGFSYYESGQLKESIAALNLANFLNPHNRATLYNLGWQCEQVRDFRCAREKYLQAAKLGLPLAYSTLAQLSITQDQDDAAAVDLLLEGLRLHQPDDLIKYSLYKNLGWARLEQSRYEEASESLQNAINIAQDKASAYCLLAQVKEGQGEKEAALPHWQNCWKYAKPEIPEEDRWKGIAFERLQFKKDVSIDP